MGFECSGARGPDANVVEVWALFGRRVLDVQHLGGTTSQDSETSSYTIGESHDAGLVVPPAGLPQEPVFPLVRGQTLNFTASMRGEVTFEGKTLSLRALVRDGHARACGSMHSYTLQTGARCRVVHNAVTFLVNVVPAGEPLRLGVQSSRRFWASNARSLVLFASVLIPAYFATPEASTPAVEMDERLTDETVVAFSSPPEPLDVRAPARAEPGDSPADRPDEETRLRIGRGRDDAGGLRTFSGPETPNDRLGQPSTRASSRHRRGRGGDQGDGSGGGGDQAFTHGPSGEESGRGVNPDGGAASPGVGSGLGREPQAAPAPGQDSGHGLDRRLGLMPSGKCERLDLLAIEAKTYTHHSMLSFLRPCEATPQMARNFDPDMMDRNVGILGRSHANHALTGPYGSVFELGNDDEDVWGSLGEADRAFPSRSGLAHVDAAGSPRRGFGRSRVKKGTPRVRQAKARVKGDLDPDIIRRIVRAHVAEIRYCYAGRLSSRPKLSGRVAIQFTIDARGNVTRSAVARSSLGDRRGEKCIAAAVRRWKFPKPADGREVVVTYPFVLDRA